MSKQAYAYDNDGERVEAGDKIYFSLGIPLGRVEGVLFERDGKLIMPTPDLTPKEATIGELRYHFGGFWKVAAERGKEAIPDDL